MRSASTRIGWPLAAVVALLGAWELYVDLGAVSTLVLPPPHAVATALWVDRGVLARDLLITAREIVLGILLASVGALIVAVAIHLWLPVRRTLYPLLVASQAVPVVILAPIFVLWLGFGLLPKLAIVGLVCFFPIVVTTIAALESVDPEVLKLMRTFDASRSRTFRLVELPAALPGLLTGIKLAAVFSVIGAVFAEWTGSDSGLGYLLTVTVANLEMAEAFAAAVVLCLFAVALFTLMGVIERRALPWAHRTAER